MSMSDVVLTQAQFDALKTVCERASELVTTLPYISMMGGNVTRQNMTVQALATALEAVKDVDFENVRPALDIQYLAPGTVMVADVIYTTPDSWELPDDNHIFEAVAKDVERTMSAIAFAGDKPKAKPRATSKRK